MTESTFESIAIDSPALGWRWLGDAGWDRSAGLGETESDKASMPLPPSWEGGEEKSRSGGSHMDFEARVGRVVEGGDSSGR